jgi:NAD(P)-dependent dehydrogenase (short-subunit alcohol dehydrogenase family)
MNISAIVAVIYPPQPGEKCCQDCAMTDLTGKTVLVTGASRGIGFVTAQALGQSGAHVIAHYADGDRGAIAATREIPDDRKLLVRADFAIPDAPSTLWREAIDWRGRVDVVISNAAIMPQVSIRDPESQWDSAWASALQINAVAPAKLIRHAVNHFLESGGGIIVAISSWAAQRGAGNENLMAYAASKAALGAMAKTVARAHAKDNILVYLVAPGVVRTEMSLTSARNQGGEQAVTNSLAMGEWVPPAEIANLVTYLSSGACRHLTGATLDVNGASYVR